MFNYDEALLDELMSVEPCFGKKSVLVGAKVDKNGVIKGGKMVECIAYTGSLDGHGNNGKKSSLLLFGMALQNEKLESALFIGTRKDGKPFSGYAIPTEGLTEQDIQEVILYASKKMSAYKHERHEDRMQNDKGYAEWYADICKKRAEAKAAKAAEADTVDTDSADTDKAE